MACDNILDILEQESGRFGPEIYDRVFATEPWVGLVKRGAFPDEMGSTISVLTYERAAPTTTTDWDSVAPQDVEGGVEGGSCLPTPVTIAVGSTTRTYGLKRRVLEGPDFCVTDLRFKFQLRAQLEKILGILSGYSAIEWAARYRRDYSTLAENKTVVDAGWASTSTTTTGSYAPVAASSILTQGILNFAKAKLLRNGAAQSALGRENAQPILTLVASYETSDRLIFDNEDIRQDIRWGRPSELLAGYGVERSYRGFYHIIDPYPRRFSFADNVYTEISPFTSGAATKGTKASINPSWETAAYEESFIFDPEVFHSLIPAPITNPAPNFVFDPVTYLGDWRLKNIIDRVCNPDGTIVYHRGTLGHAPMPIHPERGWAFIHKRCDPLGNLVTTCT